MDKIVAQRMEIELSGKTLGGWTIGMKLGNGKSAVVFRATRGTDIGAVKVFDRDLVDRYGKTAQKQRVDREKSLVGKRHPNLIEILDAGYDETLELFFVVMELFPGKNLKEALASVPKGNEHAIISQVASAAEFLEGLQLVHRDIKPENIGITDDFSRAVLLDLGVLRPTGGFSDITDEGGRLTFVGTLRYSPPELLFRTEDNSTDGWRAITFYQLGGVLHDLLVRSELFANLDPYARLVEAIRDGRVEISAPDAPMELRQLAQDCLAKEAATRLQLVSWERFQRVPRLRRDINAVRERIAQFHASARAARTPGEHHVVDDRRQLAIFTHKLDRALRDACKTFELPPFRITSDEWPVARHRFLFDPDDNLGVAFALYVEGAVTAAKDHVVKVEVAAAAAQTADKLPATAPREWFSIIYNGVNDDIAVAADLEEALLSAYEDVVGRASQGLVSESVQKLTVQLERGVAK